MPREQPRRAGSWLPKLIDTSVRSQSGSDFGRVSGAPGVRYSQNGGVIVWLHTVAGAAGDGGVRSGGRNPSFEPIPARSAQRARVAPPIARAVAPSRPAVASLEAYLTHVAAVLQSRP